MYAKDVLDRMKSEKERNATDYVLEKSRANITASLVGAGVGLVIGYTRRYNLFTSALVGAVVVGLASQYLLPKS